jgi:hypothetical protein
MMSKPYTKPAEEEKAPKPPSIIPGKTDLRIWAIQEKGAEMMKACGYNPETDFCKFRILPLISTTLEKS